MREYLRLTVAGAVSIAGRILWRRYVEQLTRSGDVLGAAAVGEETIVTDAVEPIRQNVKQEAPDELVGRQDHRAKPLPAVASVILVPEGYAPFFPLVFALDLSRLE
jgi:hypothetical protein